MKIFVETANTEAVRRAQDAGLCDGVVTDPGLVARERKNYRYVVRDLARTAGGPVFAAVTGESGKDLRKEARELSGIAENVVVRLPPTLEGLRAAGELVRDNRPVDVSPIFSPAQAALAARARAAYVSTSVVRAEEGGTVAIDLVRDSLAIFDNYGYEIQFVVGGASSVNHFIEAALAGAEIVALEPQLIETLFQHPVSLAVFERDRAAWESIARDLPVKKVIQGDRET